jgi:hypothetical protein
MRGISEGHLLAADILSSVGNFQSAAAINVVLGKLIIHQLTGRIARREAVSLAYTCQLLLQTLPLVKQELKETGFSSYWREETKRILGEASDLDQITNPSLLPETDAPLHPNDYVDPTPTNSNKSVPPTPPPAQSAPATASPLSATPCSAGRSHEVCGSSPRSGEESPASTVHPPAAPNRSAPLTT